MWLLHCWTSALHIWDQVAGHGGHPSLQGGDRSSDCTVTQVPSEHGVALMLVGRGLLTSEP